MNKIHSHFKPFLRLLFNVLMYIDNRLIVPYLAWYVNTFVVPGDDV